MASILFESPQQPTPEHEALTEYPAEGELNWNQYPVIQDALQWCLKRPKDEWGDSEYVEQVAGFLKDRSHALLEAAEKLKLQNSTEDQALEQATKHFFAARMLAGLRDIITETRDITWLESLIEQDKNTNVRESEEANRILKTAQAVEPSVEPEIITETSLTDQVIRTMVVNEKLEASEIEVMIESISAFENEWLISVVEELKASADTISKETAVDKLTELFICISNETKLNRSRIENTDGSLTSHEVKLLKQANIILQVADRVFRDLSSRINRTGDIKKCTVAVMDAEIEELRTGARDILKKPVFASKHAIDKARQKLEVLKTGMPEEAYQNTSSPQVPGMDKQEPEPVAAIDDGDAQPGMPEVVDGAAQSRFTSVEKPSFVRSITMGGEPVPPSVASKASSQKMHDISETRLGGLDAPVAILTPEVRKSLIDIALALGDDEAAKIARKDQHSSEEIELLMAMAHKAHLLKNKRADASGQNTGRPDIIERARALGGYARPLRGKSA